VSRTFALESAKTGRRYALDALDVHGFYEEHIRGVRLHRGGSVRVAGTFLACLLDEGGELVDVRAGQNLVTAAGLAHIASMLAGSGGLPPDFIGIGTGSTPPNASDLALQAEIGTRGTAVPFVNNSTCRLSVTIPAGISTGLIAEAGRFTALTSGVIIARFVFDPMDKTSGRSLPVTHDLTFA
jgi:hypothetical protein